jgi:hypothetical protein
MSNYIPRWGNVKEAGKMNHKKSGEKENKCWNCERNEKEIEKIGNTELENQKRFVKENGGV